MYFCPQSYVRFDHRIIYILSKQFIYVLSTQYVYIFLTILIKSNDHFSNNIKWLVIMKVATCFVWGRI